MKKMIVMATLALFLVVFVGSTAFANGNGGAWKWKTGIENVQKDKTPDTKMSEDSKNEHNTQR